MVVGVAEFLEKVSKLKSKKERIEALKYNDSYPLRTVLQAAFDKRIKFLLPDTDPPYKENDLVDQQHVFLRDCRKLVYFCEGPYSNIPKAKRENMFIEMLETVDKQDAKMLLQIKNKRLPWKQIDENICREAFPNLLHEQETQIKE